MGDEVELVIRDLEGKVRFRRKGTGVQSQKALLRALVAECVASNDQSMRDWRNLDLRGLDFSGRGVTPMIGMILDGSDITGCCFDRVDGTDMSLQGVIAKPTGTPSDKKSQKTTFRGFISRGGTKFCAMEAEDIDFTASVIRAPTFRGAKLSRMVAENVRWWRPIMTYTEQVDCDYTNGKVRNGDWGNSLNERPILRGADLMDTVQADVNRQISRLREAGHVGALDAYPGDRFQDQYRNAVFAGAITDDDTRISGEALKADKALTRWFRGSVAVAAVIGTGVASIGLDLIPVPELADILSWKTPAYGGGFLLLVAIAKDLLVGQVVAPIFKKLEQFVDHQYVQYKREIFPGIEAGRVKRQMMTDAWNRMKLVGVTGAKRDMAPLLRALQTVSKKRSGDPLSQIWQHYSHEDHRIVVCDRRHLAAALGHISANRARGYRLPRDIILARESTQEWRKDTPSTVTFKKCGKTVLGWQSEGEMTHLATYDVDGLLVEQFDIAAERHVPLPPDGELLPGVGLTLGADSDRAMSGPNRDLLAVFENSLTDDHLTDADGYSYFDYDPVACYIAAGKDGSLHVRSKRTHRHHNPNSYSFIPFDHIAPSLKDVATPCYAGEGTFIGETEHIRQYGSHFRYTKGFDPMDDDTDCEIIFHPEDDHVSVPLFKSP
jgi:uncharacterized protein YjbI with pentapeptide repeats